MHDHCVILPTVIIVWQWVEILVMTICMFMADFVCIVSLVKLCLCLCICYVRAVQW